MTITRLDGVTEFPLCWPDSKPRAAKRQGRTPFNTTLAKAYRKIEDELKRWRVRGYVVSMAPPSRQGLVDPGVAVWFNMPPREQGGAAELRVVACDNWPWREDNLHAIALTLERLRSMERYGTYTMWQAIEGARLALPPPVDPNAPKKAPWWEVLEVERQWPREAIEALARTRAAKHHPDTGGSDEAFKRFQDALEDMRREKGGP